MEIRPLKKKIPKKPFKIKNINIYSDFGIKNEHL